MNDVQVHPIAQEQFPLSPDQVDFYTQEGYLAIDRLAPTDDLIWMRQVADELFANHSHADIPGRVDSPSAWVPELLQTACVDRALSVVRQILHPDAVFLADWFLDKRPRHPETIWHQDEWRRDRSRPFKYADSWFAIDDATPDNGCIQVIPKSHTQGIVQRSSDLFREILAMPVVVCPLPAGGCAFWHSRMFHYAGFNTSGKPRRAYAITFGWLPREQMIEYLLDQMFGAGQRERIATLRKQRFSVGAISDVSLDRLVEDAGLFRKLLAEPAGQRQLRAAIGAQLNPRPEAQQPADSPHSGRSEQQKHALSRQKQLMKEKRAKQ